MGQIETTPIDQRDLELVRRLVWQREAQLDPVARQIGTRKLNLEEREAIRDVLLKEMLEFGLGADDEPNEYGQKLDDLIGRLGNY